MFGRRIFQNFFSKIFVNVENFLLNSTFAYPRLAGFENFDVDSSLFSPQNSVSNLFDAIWLMAVPKRKVHFLSVF